MPDTSIPLGIKVPQPEESGLSTLGQFARTQNWLNQSRLFEQTFAARQKAGKIIAASDPNDPDGLTRALQSDPQIAPYAADILNSIRQSQSTLLDLQGKQLGQSQSVFQSVLKALPAAMADPKQLETIIKSQMATLPKGASVSPQVREALGNLVKGLTDGLPEDPKEASALFSRRAAGWSLAGGVTPEVLTAVTGKPEMQNLGSRIQPGLGPSPVTGQGFRPAGEALPLGLAPQVTEVTGGGPKIPVGGQYGTPGLAGPGLAGPGASGVPAGTSPPLGIPQPEGAPTSSAAQAPVSRPAGDGSPLAPPGSIKEVPNLGKGLGGTVIPQSEKQKDELQKEFSTTGLDAYKSANMTLGSLKYMDAALDNLVKGGGFNPNVPGTAMQFRTDITKGINTIAQIFDGKPPFDPAKIASIEDFNKETKRMGLMVTKQFLGGQREAASIIQGVTSSVPGTENTYLGGKLVSASIAAATQREIDIHDFQLEWQNDPRNQGNLAGSVEAFNKLHPAEGYTSKVLDSFGLAEGGFKSPEAVKDALRQGYLTRPQAEQQLQKQWPDRFQ